MVARRGRDNHLEQTEAEWNRPRGLCEGDGAAGDGPQRRRVARSWADVPRPTANRVWAAPVRVGGGDRFPADKPEGTTMAQDIKELLEMELQDTYSAEQQILEALPKLQKAAKSRRLQQAFQEHLDVTKRQVQRLEEVCEQLGFDTDGKTCQAMEGLVEEAEEIMDELDQGPVRDAALVGAQQKIEHYEMAAYGTLTAMLKAMGESKCADLMAQTLKEEKDTDELLSELAESEINPAALGKPAANDTSGGSRATG
jgi:ferritin-like metal-binding protein YciE